MAPTRLVSLKHVISCYGSSRNLSGFPRPSDMMLHRVALRGRHRQYSKLNDVGPNPFGQARVVAARDRRHHIWEMLWGKQTYPAGFRTARTVDVPDTVSRQSTEPYALETLQFGPGILLDVNQTELVVRKEHLGVFRLIEKMLKKGRNGLVLWGQPGQGKSYSLYYVLSQFLLRAQPVILQIRERQCLLFSAKGVLDALECPKRVPVLVDSSIILDSPDHYFHSSALRRNFFVVLATSPAATNYKRWAKYSSADYYMMENWSWEEIYAVGTQLYGLHYDGLLNACSRFGPNPEHDFQRYADPKNREWQEGRIKTALDNLVIGNKLFGLARDLQSFDESREQVLFVNPDEPDRSTFFTSLASKDIAMCLSDTIERHSSFGTSELLQHLMKGVFSAPKLAGALYETLSLLPLDKPGSTLDLTVTTKPKLVHVFSGTSIHEDQ